MPDDRNNLLGLQRKHVILLVTGALNCDFLAKQTCGQLPFPEVAQILTDVAGCCHNFAF